MADEALANAVKRRDELASKVNKAQQDIDEWKRELARVDAFIAQWHAFAGTPEVKTEEIDRFPIASGLPILPKRRTGKNNSKKEEVAAEARRIIEERGSPVSRADLFAILTKRGLRIEGTDPDMVLSTMLWRAGAAAGVVRLSKGGYWLKEQPWPEANYEGGESVSSSPVEDEDDIPDDQLNL